MKRLAVAYADRNRLPISEDNLPKDDLYPVLIRCREWREQIRKPLHYIFENFHSVTGQSGLKGFASALQPLLKKGFVIILIDGLDEIHSDADREIFVANIENFIAAYPQTRLIITSREAGFSLVVSSLARFCDRWRIAPLTDDAISKLTRYWHQLMGVSSPNHGRRH
jgi:predicted NACHT family NTPase